jgi:hypothetical protein
MPKEENLGKIGEPVIDLSKKVLSAVDGGRTGRITFPLPPCRLILPLRLCAVKVGDCARLRGFFLSAGWEEKMVGLFLCFL